MPEIERSCNLKILGVGVDTGYDFSVTQYVQRLATCSVQTMYALRVLRVWNMEGRCGRTVYRLKPVVIFVQRVAVYTVRP